MNKRGFTLMEVLAVLLVLAVIASLAIPGIRSANFEIKNSQAKTATKRLLEGINSYRQASRGGTVTFPATGFDGTFVKTCNSAVNTGIPGQTGAQLPVAQLAACGFISQKDFKGLPYKFYDATTAPSAVVNAIPAEDKKGTIVLMAIAANAKAGAKYYNESPVKYAIYIDDRLEPIEYEAS